MVIVNYWLVNDAEDGEITLAGIANDVIDLWSDPDLIIDAIENHEDFSPKFEVVYEIVLVRALIASDPLPEPAFVVQSITETEQDENGGWGTPPVRI